MKKRNPLSAIVLTMAVVGFPLISWWYLQTGANYYVEQMSKLADYGVVEEGAYKGRLTIISHIEEESIKDFESITAQFEDRKDVLFLFTEGSARPNCINCEGTVKDKVLRQLEKAQQTKGIQQNFKNSVAIIDDKGIIRNTYVSSEAKEVKDLIAHIALLLPKKEKPSIEWKREREK